MRASFLDNRQLFATTAVTTTKVADEMGEPEVPRITGTALRDGHYMVKRTRKRSRVPQPLIYRLPTDAASPLITLGYLHPHISRLVLVPTASPQLALQSVRGLIATRRTELRVASHGRRQRVTTLQTDPVRRLVCFSGCTKLLVASGFLASSVTEKRDVTGFWTIRLPAPFAVARGVVASRRGHVRLPMLNRSASVTASAYLPTRRVPRFTR